MVFLPVRRELLAPPILVLLAAQGVPSAK